jgi:hypothetical protein
MTRSLLVVCLLFAGIWLLASLGWALCAGGFLVFALWRREPDWQALASKAAVAVRSLAARARSAPRRATAVTGMGGGLVMVPAGLSLAAGPGVAIVAGGVLLAGVGLLTGWGA